MGDINRITDWSIKTDNPQTVKPKPQPKPQVPEETTVTIKGKTYKVGKRFKV